MNKDSLRDVTFYLLIASLLIPVAFFILDLIQQDKIWFGRSGSIVVCIGVYLSYSRFKDFLMKPYLTKKHSKEKLHTTSVVQEQLNETLLHEIRRKELAILIFGTMIWGYGDLLIDLIIN